MSVLDAAIRGLYRTVHHARKVYWRLRRPVTKGALVALWYRDQVLVVKNTYRREITLPGGCIKGRENASEAAVRELHEECGIDIAATHVRAVYHGIHLYEHRLDDVTIVEAALASPPRLVTNCREIAWASFAEPATILRQRIVPHLAEYLRGRQPSADPHTEDRR